MREGDLQGLVAKVQRFVELFEGGLVLDEIEDAAVGMKTLSIVIDAEARIQVGVETQAALEVFFVKGVLFENAWIGHKTDEGAVCLIGFAL